MTNMLLSLAMIIIGFSIGYIIQRLLKTGKLKFRTSELKIRKRLQFIAMVCLTPVPIISSVWVAPLRHIEILSLPIIGISALTFGAVFAYAAARMMHMTRPQLGTSFVCGGFTNLGSLGGLIVFFLIGETGYAMVAFYILFERIFYFMIGFPFAKNHSLQAVPKSNSTPNPITQFLSNLTEPFILASILPIIIGVLLNLFSVPRPDFFKPISNIIVPLISILLLTSIGMALRFSSTGKYIKPALIMIIIKSLIVPAATVSLGFAFGLHRIADGIPLQVVLILSAMPVGFTALVPPTLYDLDLDLANTNWLFSTASLIIVVPILSILITLI
jgi:predicted permease